MQIRQVMKSQPASIPPGAGLDHAYRLMRRLHLRHLPVMKNDKLLGIVSMGDLLRAAAPPDERLPVDKPVSSVMSRGVCACTGDSDTGDVASLMLQKGIGCMPVLFNGELIGMVTARELMKALVAVEDRNRRRLIVPSPGNKTPRPGASRNN